MSTVSRNARTVKTHHVSPDLYDAEIDGNTWDQDFAVKDADRWRCLQGYVLADGQFEPTCGLDYDPEADDFPTADDLADYRQWCQEQLDRDLAELSDIEHDIEHDPEDDAADYDDFEPGDGSISDRDVERATGSFG